MNRYIFPGRTLMVRGMAICGIALCLSSLNPAECIADMLVVPTDTSWRTIGPVGNLESQNINSVGLGWESSNLGWNSSLAFDDSDSAGWGQAIFNGHSNIPNSIWPSGNSTGGPTPAYFRKKITINGTPTLGTVDFIVDDDVQLYINGDLVFNDTDGLANFENGINIVGSLIQGENLIALKAYDRQGTEGFGGTFEITFVPIPEPTSLVLSALGLLGLVIIACRRTNSRERESCATR